MTRDIHLEEHVLKIMYWNARSARSKIEELQRQKHEFDIIICVESWLIEGEK